jgi:hypothetical protein
MILVSLTVFFNTEINQSWNHNKADKVTKHISLINHWYLQDYLTNHIESWDVYLFFESSSELSCLLSTKKNEEKWHDTSN